MCRYMHSNKIILNIAKLYFIAILSTLIMQPAIPVTVHCKK